MSKLPVNISLFLAQHRKDMKGNPDAINTIQSEISRFNQAREYSKALKNIQLYPYSNQKHIIHQQLYVINISARRNSYYHCRKITFYMFVFDNYPKQPPQFLVGNVLDPQTKEERNFLHLNIDKGNGKICMLANQQGKQYYECTKLSDLLIQLENTIYNPNISSAYPSELYDCYERNKGDLTEYYSYLNKQATMLPEFDDDSDSEIESEDSL